MQKIVPNARIAIGHGKMNEKEMEDVMLAFIDYKYDVLVATTIIENGIDIPRANTIIINRADNYGLSQLYQLRGRVRRSNRRARVPAYPERDRADPDRPPPPFGHSRILRSRGRLPYCRSRPRAARLTASAGSSPATSTPRIRPLHEDARAHHRGAPRRGDRRRDERLHKPRRRRLHPEGLHHRREPAPSPTNASPTPNPKRCSSRIHTEIEDRYGRIPDSVNNLFAYGRLRKIAERLGIVSVDRAAGGIIAIKLNEGSKIDPEKLMDFVGANEKASFSPNGIIRFERPATRSRPPRICSAP